MFQAEEAIESIEIALLKKLSCLYKTAQTEQSSI